MADFERRVATVPGVLFDYVLHPDGTDRFLWVSARARDLLELEPAELVADSRRFWSLVPPEELPALADAVQIANRAGGRLETEFRVRLPSGRVRWLRVRSDPEPGPGGPERVWSGVLVDTTEQHQTLELLQQERSHFRSLIEHSLDLVLRVGRDGRVRYVNAAFQREGWPADRVVGRRVEDLGLEASSISTWREALARAFGGEVAKGDVSTTGPGGSRHLEVLLVPELENGEVASVLGVGRDVTDRLRAEQAARDADRRKSEFLAMLSHELRNPLAPIRNALHILDHTAPGDERAGRALEVIERQVGQLAHLVDDLLDLTRIERNRIQLQRQPLELNDLVRRTAEDHRASFEAAGVALTVASAPERLYVNGDAARLAQVVANLLQNSAKFTGRGGETHAEVARVSADRAAIRISDTGMGMTAETLARAFQPFAQEETGLARSKGGLGLGLALVKGLVESHDGEVRAHSAGPGRGTTFEVLLPLLEPAARTPPPPAPAAGPRRRILIVEDNADAAATLREVLELDGHEVAVARGGLEALARARERPPEVLLCDLGLPDLNGYEVAQAFRQDARLRNVHLVAVSGYALPEDVRRATEAGFELHISKPPALDRLAQALAAMG